MQIKQTTIGGIDGDVTIMRSDAGATIRAKSLEVDVGRNTDRDQRYDIARRVARAVYGTARRGEPNATNSMIHDILREIERVAGC
ncbi:MAG: hypothetical protein H6818_22610 [Phycisphaerales bacterium]|nr:hypothetical protein [Phycisphaerales bacterium]